MRFYWYLSKNFGDALNPYLIRKISGVKPKYCPKFLARFGIVENISAIGSVFGHIGINTIVWGSGIISNTNKKIIKKPKKILAIRGPLTRKRLISLGIDCPKIYGDPALLLPKYYKPKSKKKYEIGIIPHHYDYKFVKNKIKDKRIKVIDIKKPVEEVIEEIYSCKKTISSSLHGLIVSHAYAIDSLWVEFSNKVIGNGFKFRDYLLSVNLDLYKPYNYKKSIPDYDTLLSLFQNKNFKIKIDLKPLENNCPFKNKNYYAQINPSLK